MKFRNCFRGAVSVGLSVALVLGVPASAFAAQDSVGSGALTAQGSAASTALTAQDSAANAAISVENVSHSVVSGVISGLFSGVDLYANTADKVVAGGAGDSKGDLAARLSASTTLLEKFDLRDPNGDGDREDSVITSVKSQNPWGTCWGFSAIAASESGILSRAANEGKTIENLDLSELQLADSVYRCGGAPADYVGEAQAGEGYRNETGNPNYHLEKGGDQLYASSIFASGIGPVAEAYAPYKNKENKYAVKLSITNLDGENVSYKIMGEDEIAQKQLEGYTVEKAFYAGNYKTESGQTTYTDWTIQDDLWNVSTYEFENANRLPETRILDKDENKQTVYKGTNLDAVAEIKAEMQYSHRAISMSYAYGENYENQTNWTTYCNKPADINHAVTIIGWDDSIPAENFSNADGAVPEGSGGWLVKNSWGSETESFPNGQLITKYGIEENGVHTGYFWISYYDQSISEFESFDFDLEASALSDEFLIDQYDYLPVAYSPSFAFDEKVSSANVFTAQSDMCLRTLACTTYVPSTTVTYELYLLDAEAKSPTDPAHSKLVLTQEDTWHYAGYHRFTLPQENWVAMRQGQRYAVVVTQKCNTDGKWYQGVGMAKGKPGDMMISQYTQKVTVATQISHMLSYYYKYLEDYKKQGMEEQAAKQKAITDAQERIKQADEVAAIEKEVAAAVEEFKQVYWVSCVNEGESYVKGSMDKWMSGEEAGGSESSASGAALQDVATGNDQAQNASAALASSEYSQTEDGWADWSQLAAATAPQGVATDNMAIKSYSEIESWASVEELRALRAAAAAARTAIENDAISTDGLDISESEKWITQQQKDALLTALPAAEALLTQAGEDFESTLLNTTPTSDDVNAAIQTLQFTEAAGSASAGAADPGTPAPTDSSTTQASYTAPANTTASAQEAIEEVSSANAAAAGDIARTLAAFLCIAAAVTLTALAISKLRKGV